MNSHPAYLVSTVLGSEGKNSILSLLKKLGYVEGLSCESSLNGGDTIFYEISVSLTDEGLRNWRDVARIIFNSIDIFKNNRGSFPEYIFKELNIIRELNWRFSQRTDRLSNTMTSMLRKVKSAEDFNDFPLKNLFISKFDEQKIAEFFSYLKIENCFVTIFSKVQPENLEKNNMKFQREQWMNVNVGKRPWTEEEYEDFNSKNNCKEELINWPPQNNLLPDVKNLEILDETVGKFASIEPKTLYSDIDGELNYIRDSKFLVPKVYLKFNILTPAIRPDNPKSIALGHLYTRFVEERLNEISYEASYAGLHYDVYMKENRAINFSISGYSDKIGYFLKNILNNVLSPELTKNEFDIFYQSQKIDYENFSKANPMQQGFEKLSSVIVKEYSSHRDILLAIKSEINFEELKKFVSSELFKQTFIEGFIGGNISDAESLKLFKLVKEKLSEKKLVDDEKEILSKEKFLEKVKKCELKRFHSFASPNYIESKFEVKGNAVIWILELISPSTVNETKEENDWNRVALSVLGKLIQEPFYSEIRTKQQVGYIVQSQVERKNERLFLHTYIQSNTHDPRDLLSRIELFMENFIIELKEDLTINDRLESIKHSLLERLQEPFDNLSK
ncbi:hypothetical protein HK099_004487 [Clydaea vesicula]|uniref:Uncharacterized protein n=1 Tax=Clydaea vesicula TaxID=447962 RepID=A0AAD5U065_9FUNG|nr:hypothetical protein HK099_004487 [Clydaea vesicula]